MSERGPRLGRMALPGRAVVAAWIAAAARDARRAALAGCAAVLLVVAWVAPLGRQDVIDSVQFSIAFFAAADRRSAVRRRPRHPRRGRGGRLRPPPCQ